MRKYKAFGSHDKTTWETLASIDASSAEQARTKARAEDGSFAHYAVVPARNWSAATPKEKTTVTWTEVIDGQLTVDDVLAEGKERIREALDKGKDDE